MHLARITSVGLALLGLWQPAWADVPCWSNFATLSESSNPEALTANSHWQLIETLGRGKVSLPTLEKLIAAENPFEIPEQDGYDLSNLRTKMKRLEGMVREKGWYTPEAVLAIRAQLNGQLDVLRGVKAKREVSLEETQRHDIAVIERKHNAKEALNPSELRFLYELEYELDGPTKGFKFSGDPRLKKIRDQRDQRKDLVQAIGDGIAEEEISLTSEDAVRGRRFHYGDLDLRGLTSVQGLTLPTTVHGSLYLSGLTSAQGLILPTTVYGSLYLSGLTSAQGLTFPTTVHGGLDLSSLTSAQGLTLPTTVHGSLYLRGLTSGQGLTLPRSHTGNYYGPPIPR